MDETPIYEGGSPIRFDFEYNQIMKELAEELGVEVIDAGAVLNQTPADYMDGVHPDQNGHKKIAYLLAERLREKLAVGVTSSNMSLSPPTSAACPVLSMATATASSPVTGAVEFQP